jgi:hypothetical protein
LRWKTRRRACAGKAHRPSKKRRAAPTALVRRTACPFTASTLRPTLPPQHPPTPRRTHRRACLLTHQRTLHRMLQHRRRHCCQRARPPFTRVLPRDQTGASRRPRTAPTSSRMDCPSSTPVQLNTDAPATKTGVTLPESAATHAQPYHPRFGQATRPRHPQAHQQRVRRSPPQPHLPCSRPVRLSTCQRSLRPTRPPTVASRHPRTAPTLSPVGCQSSTPGPRSTRVRATRTLVTLQGSAATRAPLQLLPQGTQQLCISYHRRRALLPQAAAVTAVGRVAWGGSCGLWL